MTSAPGAPKGPWFNGIAEFLGTAYLRNSFTKGRLDLARRSGHERF